MIFKKYDWNLVIRIVLLFVTLSATAWLLVNGYILFMMLLVVVIIIQVIDLYRFSNRSRMELEQFVESVHYRDFSRHFDEKNAPVAIQPMRKGFNEINSTLKLISKERETQYQYLQKILELVDTGILSYNHQDGEVMWMNESLKQLLNIPYLKTIQSLQKRDETLYNEILGLKPGDHKVVPIVSDKNNLKILLSATAFQTDGKVYKLVAFQNINEALDETESKAWQKLLSVMTHEIMNSVAPISSLADTLKNRLQLSLKELNNNAGSLDDLELGIETIKKRSEGLLRFAETYRNLNKITTPNVKKIFVRDMFENMHRLMQPTLEQKNIELDIILKDPGLELEVDPSLIEQVLINLILNATEAVKEVAAPRIHLSGYNTGNNKTVIKVSDNGVGISAELMEKIFVPFFSTRKTGSGIGLSLCKQIMMLHKGTIQVNSVPGEGTAFSLWFDMVDGA
ncbi:MAG: HAMP domain-containing sensor histidine kinase [Ferruginibacter sp.]|nr:HAMP domain-containing histidine kinase [Bacteroidota bacterium]MBX2919180.1 HAMP domain-containing histidine kinase [Ferruginibacter sp.]MCC7378528.1 HAMP domain-containing histidine kinase [Chitinophagaceae bacterium]